MAIKMVRQPSDTPNINNIDDIVGLRYAYGNQDGYVIGKGNELGYTIEGNKFKVNSGRVVLQGVESDVDANGITLTVDNVSELRYYTVYYQVSMAINATAILLSNYDTATYPIIDKGDDLTENTIGIANLELYHFTAQNGVISNVEKVVKAIEYINKDTTVSNAQNAQNAQNTNRVQNVDLSDNSVPSFGSYSMKKRKLLWEGSEYVIYRPRENTGTTKTITFNTPSSENARLEIICGGGSVNVSSNGYSIPKLLFADSVLYNDKTLLRFNNPTFSATPTNLTFSFKQLSFYVSLTSDTNVTNYRIEPPASFGVYGVYEILE